MTLQAGNGDANAPETRYEPFSTANFSEQECPMETIFGYDPDTPFQIRHVADPAPAHVLFQFTANDPRVPLEHAQLFYEAAKEPKAFGMYEAGHGLNQETGEDRQPGYWID